MEIVVFGEGTGMVLDVWKARLAGQVKITSGGKNVSLSDPGEIFRQVKSADCVIVGDRLNDDCSADSAATLIRQMRQNGYTKLIIGKSITVTDKSINPDVKKQLNDAGADFAGLPMDVLKKILEVFNLNE